jgi:hypothetical protein
MKPAVYVSKMDFGAILPHVNRAPNCRDRKNVTLIDLFDIDRSLIELSHHGYKGVKCLAQCLPRRQEPYFQRTIVSLLRSNRAVCQIYAITEEVSSSN